MLEKGKGVVEVEKYMENLLCFESEEFYVKGDVTANFGPGIMVTLENGLTNVSL